MGAERTDDGEQTLVAIRAQQIKPLIFALDANEAHGRCVPEGSVSAIYYGVPLLGRVIIAGLLIAVLGALGYRKRACPTAAFRQRD